VYFQAADGSVYHQDFIQRGIIPLLVNLSCKGTTFSNQWLLRDLEVNKQGKWNGGWGRGGGDGPTKTCGGGGGAPFPHIQCLPHQRLFALLVAEKTS